MAPRRPSSGGGRFVLALASPVVLGALAALVWGALTGPRPVLETTARAVTTAPDAALETPTAQAASHPSLVVLAFANIGGDPQQAYFADGFTEDIAAALAHAPGLIVAARGTGFAFKGRTEKAQQIGRELGAQHLLTGIVSRTPTGLRVVARLVETATGRPAWQEIFDRPLADLFILQQELTDHVAAAVAPEARRAAGERASAAGANTLAAHDLTLRARAALKSIELDSARAARGLAEQAVARDPNYAPAYLAFALSLAAVFDNRWDRDYASTPVAQRMAAASQAAANLAPGDATAHATLAMAQTYAMQHDKAAVEAERALALAPDDAEVLALAAKSMLGLGRFERAVTLLHRARLYDPAGTVTGAGTTLGIAQYQLRRYDDAVDALRPCATPSSQGTLCRAMLAAALAQAGQRAEAATEVETLQRLSPGFTVKENSRREVGIVRDLAWVRHVAEGLRKAGVPE